jgi:hypothetical protein
VKRLPMLAASLVVFALNACGGDGPTGTNGNTNLGDGSMTANINGTAWRSTKAGDKGSHSGTIYAVVGLNGSYTIALGIAGLTAPGTVNLSLASGNGSNAIVSNTVGGWSTAFNGGSGTITVTTLTANRIAGTFSFDAPAGSGNSTGTLQVRNGQFDVTF